MIPAHAAESGSIMFEVAAGILLAVAVLVTLWGWIEGWDDRARRRENRKKLAKLKREKENVEQERERERLRAKYPGKTALHIKWAEARWYGRISIIFWGRGGWAAFMIALAIFISIHPT